jgi:uncharacterized protein YndB with AHSA1/START domain
MSNDRAQPGPAKQERITLTRLFRGTLEDVWELWTTKAGMESWWGPEGFRVEVRKLELRPGGECLYDMIAVAPEMIAFMKSQSAPTTTAARLRYTAVEPLRRLAYVHAADFIPGVAPYDVEHVVDLFPADGGVKLLLTMDRMHDELWTSRAVMGWESELGKLEKLLASRAGAP